MILLSCKNISLSFGTVKILEDITFNIQDSEKVGIVGVNGAGKTTLLKIIAGILKPDAGEVFTSKRHKLAYLEQNTGLDSSRSLWDELMRVYSELIEMEKRLKQLESRISTEKDGAVLSSLMKEYSVLADKFSYSGGYEYNSKVRGVLKGLGFRDEEFELKVQALSGGQKTRLALARLLLEEPDILLLDEPTNHLDIQALEWLEEFLKNYGKSIVLVSHDRYFLDAVTHKTIELENCRCKVYDGNYSAYVSQKAVERDIQQKHYEMQQREIARLEAFIEQQKRWNRERNIIAAESRQKAIDRMDKIEKPKALPGKIRIKFKSGIISGNDVLFVENLTKEYPGKTLFSRINFNLYKKERVFLLGPNGCGKSTLVKILSGRLEQTSGSFEYGHNIHIGYYDQEQENLNELNTVIEEVWSSNPKITQTQLRNMLASFLFKGEDVFKPISGLSGGEKSRVALLKLILSEANFILLDEPTNHLDINSREALEDALLNFDGTILAVSHDRYFIKKLATRIIEFDGTSLVDYKGNYLFYMDHRKLPNNSAQGGLSESAPTRSKLEYIENKESKARQRKLEKQLEDAEREIDKIDGRLKEIEALMCLEEIYTDHIRLTALHDEQVGLKDRLEELYSLWEALSNEKEGLF
ncbi:MAG: ABC-F type ribosomal protection protein [Clostridiales bacterium]|nr:ABC-F type ribosomal protection protein [Eubacteriales bacterium]MDH7566994.1 ABC-F type ribosomal protection protein [Clostridiales bacterium]